MVMIEDTIASSKALYDAMVSPSDLSHDTTMDESLPASYGVPGSAASTKFASKRLAALDATLQTLTPKELAELRLHAALQGASGGPSPRLRAALVQLERMTAGVVKLDGAADDGRLRLAAFSEVVESLQALLALMPAFGVDDPPAAIAHRIFGGGAAPSPSPARRPSPGGATLGASARTLRNSRSTPSLRGGDAGAETPRLDPLASPALQQAMSLPVFRPAGPGALGVWWGGARRRPRLTPLLCA